MTRADRGARGQLPESAVHELDAAEAYIRQAQRKLRDAGTVLSWYGGDKTWWSKGAQE